MYDQAQNKNLLKKRRSTSSIRTRSHRKRLLKLKRPVTEKFKKSIAYSGPKKWSSLPAEFHCQPLPKDNFKAMTKVCAACLAEADHLRQQV